MHHQRAKNANAIHHTVGKVGLHRSWSNSANPQMYLAFSKQMPTHCRQVWWTVKWLSQMIRSTVASRGREEWSSHTGHNLVFRTSHLIFSIQSSTYSWHGETFMKVSIYLITEAWKWHFGGYFIRNYRGGGHFHWLQYISEITSSCSYVIRPLP